jgi:hypothetical protein
LPLLAGAALLLELDDELPQAPRARLRTAMAIAASARPDLLRFMCSSLWCRRRVG